MNAHRLNHHDIEGVKCFEARAKRKARNKRVALRAVLLGWVLVPLIAAGLFEGLVR